MRQLDENIWIHDDIINRTLRLRMTIVRLTSGGLWVHSPTALSAALKEEVDRIGPVVAIVAPNNAHNRFFINWSVAYPEAGRYVSRGIPRKLPELSAYQFIGDIAQKLWGDDLEFAVMSGVPLFDECVFLHRVSQSMIVTDLVQNYRGQAYNGFAERLMRNLILKPLGWRDICLAPPLRFDFVVTDRSALTSFLDTLQEWTFNRIVVTHGDLIEEQASEIFADLCARLPDQIGSPAHEFVMRRFLQFATR